MFCHKRNTGGGRPGGGHCSRKRHRRGGGFRLLLFGALVGLTIGLFYAPKPGAETIDSLKRSSLMEKMIRRLPV